MREQRKLAAVLAADVVGYSRLMGRDEAGTLARLKEHRALRFEPALARNGGRLVKLTGDGVLAEFGSAVDALRAAIEFQHAVDEANAEQPEEQRIVFRVGLHLGDLIVDGDDLYGDGLNIAARLEGEAPPGGIVVSGALHEAAAGKLQAEFVDLGRLSLKNIERQVQAYRVEWNPDRQQRSTASAHAAAPLPLPDKPSIAVLPFQNMSGDPEQEYFADGMVEEIVTALSRFHSFAVIARNSSFTYKGSAVDIKRVGRELGVRYVLKGSVRKGGDRIRITGQLIDAQSGAHLWAEMFEGSLTSVFDLQDQVTTKVVSAIAPKLQQSDVERARRKPTEKLDSYDCFLRGVSASMDLSKWPTSEAQDWFRRAVELDPEHAAALASLAHTIQLKAISKGVRLTPAERTEAIELSERACRLAQDDGYVLGRAAQVICYTGRQYDRSSALMEDAVRLNPNDARTWNYRGWVALMCYEPERSLQSFDQGLALDPMAPRRGISWIGMSFAYFVLGQYDKGREFAERSVELVADVNSLTALIANEVRSGRLEDARQRAVQLTNIHPGFRASHSHHLFPVRAPEFHRLLSDALCEAGISE
jgi:TolB-like protein/class 3 adenylate cyclase